MPRKDQDLERIREETQATEKKLKQRKKKRKQKKEQEKVSFNERLVAPLLLIITILISYLIMLFS